MRDRRFLLLLLCFFLSGFSALLYETSWTREFSFVFGTSNLAVSTVLAAYMGGLAVGAAASGRWLHRIRRPVLTYGLLEFGIALAALAVPFAIRASTSLYVSLFGGLQSLPDSGGTASALFYLAASFLILGVPTAFMGATLPLLARHVVREDSQIGERVGMLYAINTAGAIAGTLCTAFLLLPALGLYRTVWSGAGVNLAVFASAALLSRGAPLVSGPLHRPAADSPAESGRVRLVLALIFASGVVSFTYEVLWTRLLEHVIGGSVYAFATMLASFLLGIALGGAVAARLATTRRRAAWGFAAAELGAGLFALAAFAAADWLPVLVQQLQMRGEAELLASSALGAALLLPSTLCIGATFPFAVRIVAANAEAAGNASARVYAWNTLGAIVGSIAAGFYIIPWLRFSGTMTAAVAINMALAAAVAFAVQPRLRGALAAAVLGLVVLLLAVPSTPWRVLMSSPHGLGASKAPTKVTFYAVGRSSTVLMLEYSDGWRLRTDGLPEAYIEKKGAIPGRDMTEAFLGALPVFAPSRPRDELVVGLGGGVDLETIPRMVKRIDVVELEPQVVAANRRISGQRNVDPLSESRVNLTVNDARGALELTDQRYGAVVSQPSHPWTAGASHLYTRDFFRLVHDHMRPGGVFVQWIGFRFIDGPLLQSMVATLLDVFHHVRLYQAQAGAVLFIASDDPLDLESQVPRVVREAPEAAARLGIRVPEDLASLLILDDQGAHRFAAGAPVITDDDNLLATRSPLVSEATIRARAPLPSSLDPLARMASGLDSVYLVRRLCELRRLPKAMQIARSLPDPLSNALAQGEVALAAGRRPNAAGFFQRALDLDPTSQAARFRLVELRRQEGAGRLPDDPETNALVAGLHGPDAAVVQGWRAAAKGDWQALRRLDPELASTSVRDPADAPARQLRVIWRLAIGGPGDAAEALAILDGNVIGWSRERLALRAAAAWQAKRPDAARASLIVLGKSWRNHRGSMPLGDLPRRGAAAALEGIDTEGIPAPLLETMRRSLGVASSALAEPFGE